jgi:hypothetical protein
VKEFLRLLFAPCDPIARLVSESLDRPLPRSHRIAVQLHLLYCSACRRYRRQIRLIREALRGEEASAETAPGLSADARRRIEDTLRNA